MRKLNEMKITGDPMKPLNINESILLHLITPNFLISPNITTLY